MERSLLIIALMGLMLSSLIAGDKTINIGISQTDGDKFNDEFIQSSRSEFYRQAGFEPSLYNLHEMTKGKVSVLQIYQNLRKYHVLVLVPETEGIPKLNTEAMNRARNVSDALVKFVQNGGGLVILPQPVRYPNDDDEKYWNEVFKPFGCAIKHEGIADLTTVKTANMKPGLDWDFFYLPNAGKHPVVERLKGFWFPVKNIFAGPGVVLMDYSRDWTPIVEGVKTTQSYLNDESNILQIKKVGTIKESPVIAAVRDFGKGKVVCLPYHKVFAGENLGVAIWGQIVESKGIDGVPSDTMQLLYNSIKYASVPALQESNIGVYRPGKYVPITFPESLNADTLTLPDTHGASISGILGAHTSYSDGSGTVADYVTAAKAAGLSFIVFTDPLELLTKEKLEALKADCKKLTTEKFYACPGVEFTDGSNIRWTFFGSKVQWPQALHKQNKQSVVQWDGKVLHQFGAYSEQCAYPSSAIIDYGDLKKSGAHRENLWWFYKQIVRAYDNNKLIADNFNEYLFALRDLRALTPITFTRIKSPADVAAAANTARIVMNNLPNAEKALDTRCSSYSQGLTANQQVILGQDVRINYFNGVYGVNAQSVKGVQRVKMRFEVASKNGIKEVAIHDADLGLIRRYNGNGEKQFTRDFELVRDKQHYLVMTVTDNAGNQAISNYFWIYEYKQGLFRCGDNLNILGPLGYYWHPDRNQMLPLIKDFRNAELYSVQGWDRGGADCPKQNSDMPNHIYIEGVGAYPMPVDRSYMQGTRMNVELAGNNIQIVEMQMDELTESWPSSKRNSPGSGSILCRIKDNEYFTRIHRMYSPRDRQEHYIAWDYRRLKESLKDYDGSLQYHEGEITFKKDVTLNNAVPIPLAGTFIEPSNLKMDTTIVVKDGTQGIVIREGTLKKPLTVSGTLPIGGFASQVNSPIGYIAIIPAAGETWSYQADLPGRLWVGIGRNGQTVKAGTTLKYAYIGAAVINPEANEKKMEFLADALNAKGGNSGYPNTMKLGKLDNATFFFSVSAESKQAEFELGPQKGIGIDLPIRVAGLDNNGCVAVFSSFRPFYRYIGVAADGLAYFQEPIDEKNNIWVGNVFLSDNKDLKFTMIVDGQGSGKKPSLEIHNPSNRVIKAKVWSPDHAPLFGGTNFEVDIPSGSSIVKPLTK